MLPMQSDNTACVGKLAGVTTCFLSSLSSGASRHCIVLKCCVPFLAAVAVDLIFDSRGKTVTVEEINCPFYLKTEAKKWKSLASLRKQSIWRRRRDFLRFYLTKTSNINQFCNTKDPNVT